MDYQGNYFPDEQDENQSKVFKNIKRIFKWTMYGISILIYVVIFWVIFANGDSDILETNYAEDISGFEDIDTDNTELYRINTKIFMNDEGSLQLHNIDYYNQLHLLEIGVKFNAKKLTDNEYGDVLNFQLTDGNGNIYPIANIVTDDSGRYGFYRICFKDIKIDLDSNDLRYDPKNTDKSKKIEVYYLTVSRKSDGKVINVSIRDNIIVDKFTVYDNSTTFNTTDYND